MRSAVIWTSCALFSEIAEGTWWCWLDSMFLKIISNLNNSVVLWLDPCGHREQVSWQLCFGHCWHSSWLHVPSLLVGCVPAGVGSRAHSLMSGTALNSSVSVLSGIRNTLFPSQLSDAACIA